MSHHKHLNKINILFFTLLPIISIVGTVLLCVFSTVTWPTWVLAGSLFAVGNLSITAGYHRLFSHKTYTARWPIRLLFVLIGSATFQGSVLEWSTDHRNHHRHTDTKEDPYNIKQGFWHAHMGWIFTIDESKRDFSNVADLQQSYMLNLQHRHYTAFSIIMGFVFPAAIASLWGAPLAGLIIAGGLRITLGHHSTFCINSLCHILGKSSYSKKTSARDNWLLALIPFGEGYHNYHHRFPLDYRNGVRFYQFDPGKWLVYGLSFLGLVSNLHRIPDHRIIQAHIETHKQLTVEHPKRHLLEQLQETILHKIITIKAFEQAHIESNLKEYAIKLKKAKKELAILFHKWKVIFP
ncbi:MAG: fatty acid desaturase [Gammaproteobacteria bacterium]|nr:fatty acid desaturase [Gammaproteobacteria bacterium]